MRISIFGLGYVGAVSAGCLANEGHEVVGVDPNETKVGLINSGRSPVVEKDIDRLIEKAVSKGLLRATQDAEEAVLASDMSLICVGTPSQSNGNLDLKFVRRVCEEIGTALQNKDDFHVVVVRSTMLPGSMRSIVIPTLEEYSGKQAGTDFGVCNNPEFLREGTAVYDYYHPPKIVIGETDAKAGDLLVNIYDRLDAPLIRTSIETAEMVKYADNVWHALKVGFANEIGNICKAVGIDGHEVMEIFCQDRKLNLSPCYLKPGFAFGGSCLPKDVRALTYKAKSLDLDVPILNAIMPSNQRQIEKGLSMITEKGRKKIGILGFSFKAGTDDLRESPLVEIIERLIGKGYDVRIYDRNVKIASLIGANRDYILNHISHISKLMVDDIDAVLQHADVIVIGNTSEEFRDVPKMISDGQVIIDLVRIVDRSSAGNYDGICW
ncbi:GDP-mannose 6-dehydrogenase [Methylomarinovum tepidoasis]|uniref:UDP-glucose 6-dehydrogenase n=1 Tax=Methylomarinovum tepidoasis TaxID=2840183 RepID=A0AAU9C3X2_9GAMM|nr:UDP-glucose/GDP-mannose dehydrogenase family protein [Methylomarinovum sp. IN45]BCX87769.1 GDP-mannose 6-dehydrogenase [Methylomarinovum sp. IN45]